MRLKSYLRKTLADLAQQLRDQAALTDQSTEVLEKTNTGRALYEIHLASMWANEGEESTTTKYKGSLKQAIEQAEAEFKKRNSRGDVQARCSVTIQLGEGAYPIPKEYWEQFREGY